MLIEDQHVEWNGIRWKEKAKYTLDDELENKEWEENKNIDRTDS